MRIVLVAIGRILMVIGALVAAASGLYAGISLVATILAPSPYSVVALLFWGTICLAGIGTWGFGRALRRVNAYPSLRVEPVSKGLTQS